MSDTKPVRLSAFNERLKLSSNKAWLALGIVALIGVILMIINAYAFYSFSGDTLAKRGYRPLFNEYIIFPYYFTFISNVTAIFVPVLQLTGAVRLDSKRFQRYKIMMATNLAITLIVYWALLSAELDYSNVFGVVQTVCVHAITPVLAVIVFIYDCYYGLNARTVRPLSTTLINFSLPVAWLAFAIVMYFILGADGKEDAPYNFLNVAHNAWYLTVAYIVGIAAGYLLFTLIFALFWTHSWKALGRKLSIKKAPQGA